MDFANLSVNQTRKWIKETNPGFSELEINLEFARLMYYERGEMTENHWNFYKEKMLEKIKKDCSDRFRKMMKDNKWSYEDIAKLGRFKNGKVIEATISRGLPSFAKLAVIVYEQNK